MNFSSIQIMEMYLIVEWSIIQITIWIADKNYVILS